MSRMSKGDAILIFGAWGSLFVTILFGPMLSRSCSKVEDNAFYATAMGGKAKEIETTLKKVPVGTILFLNHLDVFQGNWAGDILIINSDNDNDLGITVRPGGKSEHHRGITKPWLARKIATGSITLISPNSAQWSTVLGEAQLRELTLDNKRPL